MGKHTPGPWRWDQGWGAIVAGDDGRGGCEELVTPVWREQDTPERLANAALIAAAPDLLEALRECITDDGACCMNTGQRDRRLKAIDAIARAAIARAEGGAK